MTQEEKQLLLKDLCARLPYGVHLFTNSKHHIRMLTISNDIDYDEQYWINGLYDIDEVKPYLRTMASMTDEEKEELLNLLFDKEAKYFYIDEEGLIDGRKFNLFKEGINYPSFCPINIVLYTNWLLENHFDFMGLIPKGLAIEVTKDDNPYE